MKYETPKLMALTPAINAIRSDVDMLPKTSGINTLDGTPYQEHSGAYLDWED